MKRFLLAASVVVGAAIYFAEIPDYEVARIELPAARKKAPSPYPLPQAGEESSTGMPSDQAWNTG